MIMHKPTHLFVPLLLLGFAAAGFGGQTHLRRSRAEGFYACESANTPGHLNIWGETMLSAFIWDSERDSATGRPASPVPQGYIHTRINAGLFDIGAIEAFLQAPTFLRGSSPGIGVGGGALKITTPNNADLRFIGGGLVATYRYSMLKEMNSLGGYRQGGTGFSPAGIYTEGPAIEVKALMDCDFLPKISNLPLKCMVNAGVRVPVDNQWRTFSQYLFSAGIAYAGLSFDAFVEYALEAFFNTDFEPKQFTYDWGWGSAKTWEVAFSENPMHLVFGGRYRYDSGVNLSLYVPLLISANVGSTMEHSGGVIRDKFPEESKRGVTDGFDPWFAQWQVILRLGIPLRYRQTAAEMRRNFLLMKNRRGGAKIDIEKRLQMLEEKNEDSENARDSKDAQRRLEEIRKRREELKQSE